MVKRIKDKTAQVLRWSERYTKTDMLYLTKGGFWVGIKRVVGTSAGLALSVALANLLPQEAFGNYKFVLSLAAVIAAFSLTGMTAAVTRAVARGYEGTIKLGVLENLKWSWGMIALSLAGAAYYFINDNSFLGAALIITAAFLPVIYSFDLTAALFKGRKDFRRDAFYALPRLLFPPLALIATLFITSNPLILLLVYFSSQAIVVVGTFITAVLTQKLNTVTDTETLRFSKHLSVMGVLDTVSGSLDKILLFHFLGAAPLAVYAFATAPINEFRKLNSLILTPAFPKLSQRPLAELKKTLPYRMGLLFLVIVPIIGAYILAAPYIYELIFPRYMESVIFSQVFALSLLFMPLPILREALTAHLRQRELYIVRTATPLMHIIFVVILLPLYGIWGAISALLLTYVTNAILVIWLFATTRENVSLSVGKNSNSAHN